MTFFMPAAPGKEKFAKSSYPMERIKISSTAQALPAPGFECIGMKNHRRLLAQSR